VELREFLNELDKLGQLKVIDQEVDWNMEAAAISCMNYRLNGPALLFNNIKGSKGRLVSSLFSAVPGRPYGRAALLFGMEPDVPWDKFSAEISRRTGNLIKPTIVSTGPCKENIRIGKDVNLFELPFPYLHYGDGGRYGTLQTFINKDLDSDWVNWGNYRMQIHTRNKVGGEFIPTQHLASVFYQKYEPANLPMPVCVAIGPDVEGLFVSALPCPRGMSEVDVAGGLAQEPIELVKAETNDLYVPARAEIILEGEMRPYERMDEGPMGEWHGFVHGPRIPEPVMRVTAITFRNNPIIPFLVEGARGADSARGISCATFGVGATNLFRAVGFPATMWIQPFQCWGPLVGALPTGNPMASEMMNLVNVAAPFMYELIAVNSDEVEPFDLEGVLESMWLKAHPSKIHVGDVDTGIAGTSAPFLSPEEKKRGLSATVSFDCTWPPNWGPDQIPQKVAFDNSYPPQIQEWVVKNWKSLGLPGEPRQKR